MANKLILFSSDFKQVQTVKDATLTKVEGNVETPVNVNDLTPVKLTVNTIGNKNVLVANNSVIALDSNKEINGNIGIVPDVDTSGLTIGNKVFTVNIENSISEVVNPAEFVFSHVDNAEETIGFKDFSTGDYTVKHSDDIDIVRVDGEDYQLPDTLTSIGEIIVSKDTTTKDKYESNKYIYYVATGSTDIQTWTLTPPTIDYIGTIADGKYEIVVEEEVSYIVIGTGQYSITHRNNPVEAGYVYIGWTKNQVLADIEQPEHVAVYYSPGTSDSIVQLVNPCFKRIKAVGSNEMERVGGIPADPFIVPVEDMEAGFYTIEEGTIEDGVSVYRLYINADPVESKEEFTSSGYIGVNIAQEEFAAYLDSLWYERPPDRTNTSYFTTGGIENIQAIEEDKLSLVLIVDNEFTDINVRTLYNSVYPISSLSYESPIGTQHVTGFVYEEEEGIVAVRYNGNWLPEGSLIGFGVSRERFIQAIEELEEPVETPDIDVYIGHTDPLGNKLITSIDPERVVLRYEGAVVPIENIPIKDYDIVYNNGYWINVFERMYSIEVLNLKSTLNNLYIRLAGTEPPESYEPEVPEDEWENILIDPRSSVVKLPYNDILLIVNEIATTKENKLLSVVPITASAYALMMSKPYKRPLKNQAWRLLNSASETMNAKYAEIITNIGDVLGKYKIRYVKKPKPIILADLGDLSIDGHSTPMGCELDPIIHREILQRAVEIGKAMYAGDLNSTLAIGVNSNTELGIVASGNNQRQQ